MGSVGDAYDNAMCESFFATLECELLERRRFASQAAARMAGFGFVEGWYNPARLLRPRLSFAHGLRNSDGDDHGGSVATQTRQHSTEAGQDHACHAPIMKRCRCLRAGEAAVPTAGQVERLIAAKLAAFLAWPGATARQAHGPG